MGIVLAASFSTSVFGALTVALIGLAIYRPLPQAVGAGALSVVLALPWVALVPTTPGGSVFTGVMILVMMVTDKLVFDALSRRVARWR